MTESRGHGSPGALDATGPRVEDAIEAGLVAHDQLRAKCRQLLRIRDFEAAGELERFRAFEGMVSRLDDFARIATTAHTA
ncbi:hypothetical protein [Amycolatopsis acidicola]|uniref:hypothetical protein n=1 Tax=Amycolatopsis acidicola TaxID=2596893 RepID=UPI001FB6177A|nr:hypothetical protein [Amycolatopsis acidicola]